MSVDDLDNNSLMVDFERADSDDGNISDFGHPKKSQLRCRLRKYNTNRKINHKWNDIQVVRLIAAVKKRPPLWNANSVEYRYSRLEAWNSVVDELRINGVDINEAKVKWGSLRVSFKQSLTRQQKSGEQAVVWRHFNQLLFLKDSKRRQSTSSPNALQDSSVFHDFPDTSKMSSTTLESTVDKLEYCRDNATMTDSTPSLLTAPSSSCCCAKETAVAKTAVTASQSTDRSSAFCEHLLFEMRALSDRDASNLRRMLSDTLWNFLSNMPSNEPSKVSPVAYVGQHGHDNKVALQQCNVVNDGPNPSFVYEQVNYGDGRNSLFASEQSNDGVDKSDLIVIDTDDDDSLEDVKPHEY